MYLSRLILNPYPRSVRRDLANLYDLHCTLMSAFPANLPAHERTLYRVDADPVTNVPTVLIQSHTAPDWATLQRRGGYLLPESRWPPHVRANPAVKTLDFVLTRGQALSFRLRINPTVKRDGRRHGLYKEEDQQAWLARKGQRNGFGVVHATVIQEGNLLAWKPCGNGSRRTLTFFAVRFEGLLRVSDPDVLWDAVRTGIGPAKSFGFGLLSLARPPA